MPKLRAVFSNELSIETKHNEHLGKHVEISYVTKHEWALGMGYMNALLHAAYNLAVRHSCKSIIVIPSSFDTSGFEKAGFSKFGDKEYWLYLLPRNAKIT